MNRQFCKEDIQTANRHIRRCLTSLIIRKMHIKTILRYHFTPVRMAIITKTKNKKCWRGCGENGNPHTLLVGMQIGTATMENSMEISQKIKNRNTIRPSYSTTGYLSKELEINNSKRLMHPYVHCSTIHNSQDLEATQVPVNW